MAFDFNGKHPHDPKVEFGPAASGEGEYEMSEAETPEIEADAAPVQPPQDEEFDPHVESEDELFEPVAVSGIADGEDEEMGLERAEKAAKASFDERLDAAKSSVSEDENGPTASVGTGGNDFDETFWGRMRSRQLGIVDRGDYMSLAGKGRKHPFTGEREVTDAQLERMVAKAVLQKGWTKQIYIMRNGRIDEGLTMRAEKIFHDKLGCPDGSCEGITPKFCKSLSDIMMSNPDNPAEDIRGRPVWTDGWLATMMHERRVRSEETAALKGHKKNVEEGNKCTSTFKRACDGGGVETPAQATEKDRQAREAAAKAAEAGSCEGGGHDHEHGKAAGPSGGMGPI